METEKRLPAAPLAVLLLMVWLLAVVVACGPTLKEVCEHNCQQLSDCRVSEGGPPLTVTQCAAECRTVHATSSDVLFAIYDQCSQEQSCDWRGCARKASSLP